MAGPLDIPGVGRFATCTDQQGVIFTLGALFGWTEAGAVPMDDYAFIDTGDAPRPARSCRAPPPARWNWYVHVPDIDAATATATATAQGGTLIQGPDQIPGDVYSVNLTDPLGHQIGLVGPRKQGA